jgi:hypothetical protein
MPNDMCSVSYNFQLEYAEAVAPTSCYVTSHKKHRIIFHSRYAVHSPPNAYRRGPTRTHKYEAYLQKAYDNLLANCCLLKIQEHVSTTFDAIQCTQLK